MKLRQALAVWLYTLALVILVVTIRHGHDATEAWEAVDRSIARQQVPRVQEAVDTDRYRVVCKGLTTLQERP